MLTLHHNSLSTTHNIKMPIINASVPPTTADDTHYVVYFASGEPSWCPDCRNALPALNAVFGDASAPSAHLVMAGSREEWKGNPNNKYRQAPYNIQCLPTVVKVKYVSFETWMIEEEALIVCRARRLDVWVTRRVRMSLIFAS
jgi:hypothetical protein